MSVMEDLDKKQAAKELKAIYNFSKEMSPEANPEILEKIREAGLNQTVYGQRFEERIQAVMDGGGESTCVVCCENECFESVICEECAAKIAARMNHDSGGRGAAENSTGKKAAGKNSRSNNTKTASLDDGFPLVPILIAIIIVLGLMVAGEGIVIFMLFNQ